MIDFFRRLVAAMDRERAEPRAAPWRPATAPAPPAFMIGVNLCGAEFGAELPGVYNRDYTYPTAAELDYYSSKGLKLIRLPFRWERLQPVLMRAFDSMELDRLRDFVDQVRRRGMRVIPEPHNFARYRGEMVGTPAVPNEAFADFWRRFATEFKGEAGIYGYGLVNEPHDTGGLWPAAAQGAVDAIRSVDVHQWILVPGDDWSGAARWRTHNEDLWIEDAAHRVIYEAHVYFDHDHSGAYTRSYDGNRAGPMIGVERLREFRRWLSERNAIGFVGEFGVPVVGVTDDERWLEALDRFVDHLHEIRMSGCYWAGGPWWGDSPLSIEPRGGEDRPQMRVLSKFL